MLVRITDDVVDLEQADDLTDLRVVTRLDADGIVRILQESGVGYLHEGSVMLRVRLLHDRAGVEQADPAWESRWDQMIEYAGRKGWLSADGCFVQAHIDFLTDDSSQRIS
ncbi:hypothetical protein ACFYXQ_16110 [Nocardia jiangxiensis]|uniref:Uncharacterized protein n=1 Tax=Nocardia jiangxiensis TaxID=282685 RepID=A0ABW6RZ43_9NOCA